MPTQTERLVRIETTLSHIVDMIEEDRVERRQMRDDIISLGNRVAQLEVADRALPGLIQNKETQTARTAVTEALREQHAALSDRLLKILTLTVMGTALIVFILSAVIPEILP